MTSDNVVPSVCNVISLPPVITNILIANLSVTSSVVCGTAIDVKYWSTAVPFVIDSGLATSLAIKVKTFDALTV